MRAANFANVFIVSNESTPTNYWIVGLETLALVLASLSYWVEGQRTLVAIQQQTFGRSNRY